MVGDGNRHGRFELIEIQDRLGAQSARFLTVDNRGALGVDFAALAEVVGEIAEADRSGGGVR